MRLIAAAAFLALTAFAPPALAQEDPTPEGGEAPDGGLGIGGFSISAGVELLSDYRFRGISRSDEDPAVQGRVTAALPNGLYFGARGTTLEGLDSFRVRDPEFEDLGDLQLDLYAGYNAEVGPGLTFDGGLTYYVFTGGEGRTNYAEPYASLSYLLGPVEATAGAKYAPSQEAIGDEAMLYLFGEVEAAIPFTPVTLTAHAGRQDWGDYGRYWNWSVGARAAFGPVTAGLRYVDTDLEPRDGQDAGIILSLGLGF